MDIVKPVQVCLLISLRNIYQFSALGLCSLDSRLSESLHSYEPLVTDPRFYYCMASVALTYRDSQIFDLYQVSCILEFLYPCLTALITVHTLVLSGKCSHLSMLVYA